MSDINIGKPGRISFNAEAGAGSRIVNKPQPSTPSAAVLPGDNNTARPTAATGQRRIGQFGAAPGVQINQRGPAPISKIPAQTYSILRSTLATVRRYCVQQGSSRGASDVDTMLGLLQAIESGYNIADPTPTAPAPAPTPTIVPSTPSSAPSPASGSQSPAK